jgi:stage II sporulation protein D
MFLMFALSLSALNLSASARSSYLTYSPIQSYQCRFNDDCWRMPPSNFDPAYSMSEVDKFQILIFPHQREWTTPHLREKVIDQVIVESPKRCKIYAAEMTSRREWTKVGPVIRSAKVFTIRAGKNKPPIYFECPAGFTVVNQFAKKIEVQPPLIVPPPVLQNQDSIASQAPSIQMPIEMIEDPRGPQSLSYAGNFVAYYDEKKVSLVNLVDPEYYHQGVVSSEVPSDWSLEALKAQAVASRTYSWYTVASARSSSHDYREYLYDMDDTVQFHAYKGSAIYPKPKQAVEQTSGQLLYSGKKIIQAFYSADNGGISESSENYYERALPYCVPVVEAELDRKSFKGFYNSKKLVTADYLTQRLRRAKLLTKNQQVKSVEVKSLSNSGRPKSVRVILAQGSEVLVDGLELVRMLGLQNRMYSIVQKGKEFLFVVNGYGHGVGLSQLGAQAYASQLSWSYVKILKKYYSGITIKKMNHSN